jgi:hypothetical protein
LAYDQRLNGELKIGCKGKGEEHIFNNGIIEYSENCEWMENLFVNLKII